MTLRTCDQCGWLVSIMDDYHSLVSNQCRLCQGARKALGRETMAWVLLVVEQAIRKHDDDRRRCG